jgi:hypothetical protein
MCDIFFYSCHRRNPWISWMLNWSSTMLWTFSRTCLESFLLRYLKHYEKDDTLDWFFHPDLCKLEALDDYQRIVPQNHVCIVLQLYIFYVELCQYNGC